MKSSISILLLVSVIQLLTALCVSQSVETSQSVVFPDHFDFFYFVQKWPGSDCDTMQSCCYPTSGKPTANFGIHGLWPYNNDSSFPSNCDPNTPFDSSAITDLSALRTNWPTLACPSNDGTKLWADEWEKHGTCSGSKFNQKRYFDAALSLKKQFDLLGVLKDAGIQPDGGFYTLTSISEAISGSTIFTPGIRCNVDENGSSQIYQVYVCVKTDGSTLIECPVLPEGKCSSRIEFPAF